MLIRVENILQGNLKIKTLFVLVFLAYSNFTYGEPGKKKFQIQIEEEIEEGIKKSGEENQKDNIVVSGEDEQLIRTFKSDTSIVTPADATAVKWKDIKDKIQKDGKKNKKETEKNGEILGAYGLYDNLFLLVNLIKSDKFGLYRLQYLRTDIPSENYNNSSRLNSSKSTDNINLSIGARLSPIYTIMVNTRYQGASVGLENNPSFLDLTRRWGFLSIKNQVKPDDKQFINADVSMDYLHSTYSTSSNSVLASLVNPALDLQWVYIFDSKLSLEADGHYDFLNYQDMFSKTNQASTADLMLLLHWPILKTFTGPSKGTPWQLNFTVGGGAYYRDGENFLPIFEAGLENRLGLWYSKLFAEKKLSYPNLKNPEIFSFYNSPSFYGFSEDYWNFYWENNFSLSDEQIIKIKGGYITYSSFFNPVLSSDELYQFSSSGYDEIYARAGWEYNFLNNFLIETSIDIRYGLSAINMVPLYSFLASFGYNSERFDGMITIKGIGSRKLDTVTISDYYLLDINLKYWINPSFALVLRGENILNQNYIEYYPYTNSGIKVFLGCFIKF